MFTREQRSRLESLSLDLFGTASKWQKVLKDPNLQVLESVDEVKVEHQFIEVKKGKFQCVKVTEEQLKKAGQPLTQMKPSYRQMNYDELENALIAALEMKNFAQLNAQGETALYEELVKRYKKGTILNRPWLIVADTDRPEFDELFKDLPEDQKEVLKAYVVPNGNPKVFSVNGIKFVTELMYQNNYVDKA